MSIDIKENKLSTNSSYRPEIDGLRAFAVVTVIINHFNKAILPNGYLGVDIFFVISGFVITSSLYKRPSRNFKDFISGFYARRIKRLVPALSVFVLITSLIVCLFNPQPTLSLRTGLASLFGLSNLYLLRQSTDYFAPSAELNVFTHTWSLGVEEQFYIIFPLMVWFSGFGRQTKNGARNLFLIVGAIAIASLIGFLYLYPINQSAGYFLMQTRFWEMAAGCLMFITFQKRRSIEKLLGKIPPLLVLSLIVGVMYLPMSLATSSTVAVVFLSLALIGSLREKTLAYNFFTNKKVVYVGLISYSLYLWHWGILSISRLTIGIHWWSIPFQLAFMLSLAIASYRYIESPLRKSSWVRKRWKTFILGSGLIISLSGVLISLEKPLKGKLFTGKVSSYKLPLKGGNECLENISKDTQCYLINNQSNKNLWILGDSHARSLYLAGEQVANSLGMNLKLYTSGGTSFPPIVYYRKSFKDSDLKNINNHKILEKKLYEQIKVGDVILLTIRYPYYFGDSYSGSPSSAFRFIKEDKSFGTQEDAFNKWISSVKNLANISQKIGAKVIIQTPTPEWGKVIRSNEFCAISKKQWFNSLQKKDCKIKSEFFIDKKIGIHKDIFEKLNQLSSSHENIYLFNTYKIVCPGSTCSFSMNGFDIYYDRDHISYEWARDLLSPEIYKFITNITDMDK